MHYALYCKVETGWCSRRPKDKSPDRDDSFDWEPASCKGNLITHLKIYMKMQPQILTFYNDNYYILIDDAIVYPTEMPTTTVSYRGGRGKHI